MLLTKNAWRDTARSVRIAFLDARAATGLAVWMLHMCWPTFWLSVVVMLLFVVLERYGVSVPAALRSLRLLLFSPRRMHHSRYTLRRLAR